MNRAFCSVSIAGCIWLFGPTAPTRADVGVDMTAAAQKFASSLPDQLAAKLIFQFGDGERLNWHFIPRDRKGVAFREMNEQQRELAHALLRTGLSETGCEKARNVMRLDVKYRELEGPNSRWGKDPFKYCFTFFGKPSLTGPWAWRLEGHHLSLNFTLRDGRVVGITPAFFGVSPADVREGELQGLRTLSGEEDKAKALLAMLDAQQRKACITATKAAREVRDVNKPHPASGDPTGIAAAKMTGPQQAALQALLDAYLANFHPKLAEAARKRIAKAGLDKIHFAWRGEALNHQPHSYQVQGPTFRIEYINKLDPLPHIHCYFRSVRNDFGLLPGQ